jgi:ABC-type phosphate transport system auxiliary subunit
MAKINLSRISARVTPKAGAPAPEAKVAPQRVDDAAGKQEIGALRDILFGTMLEQHDQEMARVETRIAMEASKIRSEFGEFARRFEDRIAEIDARTSKGLNDLREQILSQSNLLNDAIQERNEQVVSHVNKGLQDLRAAKIDRATFSSLLSKLAAHLEREGKAAGAVPQQQVAVKSSATE